LSCAHCRTLNRLPHLTRLMSGPWSIRQAVLEGTPVGLMGLHPNPAPQVACPCVDLTVTRHFFFLNHAGSASLADACADRVDRAPFCRSNHHGAAWVRASWPRLIPKPSDLSCGFCLVLGINDLDFEVCPVSIGRSRFKKPRPTARPLITMKSQPIPHSSLTLAGGFP
jgi:hypothetical protein